MRTRTASRPPRPERRAIRQGRRAIGVKEAATEFTIPIRPRRILAVMLGIAAALTAITIVLHLLWPIDSRSPTSPYLQLLAVADATSEQSIANWYSALVMLGCAGAMAWIGLLKRRAHAAYSTHWLGLAALFLFFSVDEGVGIHDALAAPLREGFGLGGVLYWGWIIPWGAVAILCAFAYTGFLIRLPPGVRTPIFAAAALFICASVGLELAEGHFYTSEGATLPFDAATIAEELGEMAALALLAYGLLVQLAGERGGRLRMGIVTPSGGSATDQNGQPRRRAPEPG